MTDLWKFIGVGLTAGATLLGIGRYIGNIEQRITQLEKTSSYLHGSFELPTGAK